MGNVKVYSFIGKRRKATDTNTYISSEEFSAQFEKAAAEAEGEVTVSINSGGGSVTDGWAIVATMQKCAKPVKAVIDGFAASMGYYICLGAKTITAAKNSVIMLHSVQGGAYGSPEELRKEAEVLDTFNKAMATLLVARTGLTEAEVIEKYLGKELYLTAQEALDLKLIDAIEDYEAQNIPAIEPNMSLQQVEFKYAAMHQDNSRSSLVEEIMAKVRERFALPGFLTPKAEPVAVELTEQEEGSLLDCLYYIKAAADTSSMYKKHLKEGSPVFPLLQEIETANAALVIKLVTLKYGEETAEPMAAATQLVTAQTEKQKATLTEIAATAAKHTIETTLAAKDNELATAANKITELEATIKQLEQSPAAKDAVVVVDPKAEPKPLTREELEAKAFK